MIYTFWEGYKPPYIDLCMGTWKLPYTLLNYSNINEYIDLPLDKLKKFSLPIIADIIRVHILFEYGGYWLDTDTIMLGNELPKENMVGDTNVRSNTIGFLHTDKHSDMYRLWVDYQNKIINDDNLVIKWNVAGNAFTDNYVKNHTEITIYPVNNMWPETYMIKDNIGRWEKYRKFYFKDNYHLKDINNDKLIMLHNSWTPDWYKKLSKDDVLNYKCTLSNILKEVN